MKYIVDLHTHLNEKKLNPTEWWNFVKSKNLCAVAITEHANFEPKSAYLKLLKRKPKNILLIPGMEANTTAGHLLIYGADEKLYNIKELQQWDIPIEKALKLVKKHNLIASFSHPFGYKHDSTCEILGEKETIRLLKKYEVGVEYYNGMLGSANGFIFGTQWIKKLYNFFDFVSNNKVGEKVKIQNKSLAIKNKLEEVSEETLKRVRNGIEFSKHASYITVGSDAHYSRVIGTAIIELKRKPKNNTDFLSMIKNKELIWAGPNIYSKEPVDKLKKKELFEGLQYITKNKLQTGIKNVKNKKMIKSRIKKIKNSKQLKRIKNVRPLTKIKKKLSRNKK